METRECFKESIKVKPKASLYEAARKARLQADVARNGGCEQDKRISVTNDPTRMATGPCEHLNCRSASAKATCPRVGGVKAGKTFAKADGRSALCREFVRNAVRHSFFPLSPRARVFTH